MKANSFTNNVWDGDTSYEEDVNDNVHKRIQGYAPCFPPLEMRRNTLDQRLSWLSQEIA